MHARFALCQVVHLSTSVLAERVLLLAAGGVERFLPGSVAAYLRRVTSDLDPDVMDVHFDVAVHFSKYVRARAPADRSENQLA